MNIWRKWLWMIALAALGPTLLYASPRGPARNAEAAARWLLLYPAWFLLSIAWLVPGICLATRLRLRVWITIPIVAVLIEVVRSGITHWPPSRWWPTNITGGIPEPTRNLFGYGVEAWDGMRSAGYAGNRAAFQRFLDELTSTDQKFLAKQLLCSSSAADPPKG
jgi:hypothetical protein